MTLVVTYADGEQDIVDSGAGGGSGEGTVIAGVTSFNTRTGPITLSSADVITALGYTPGEGAGGSSSANANVGVYISPATPLASWNPSVGVKVAFNHNLGARPIFYSAVLICTSAELGYSVGDEYDVTSKEVDATSVNCCYVNASEIGFVFHGDEPMGITTKTGSLTAHITYSKWSLVLKAIVVTAGGVSVGSSGGTGLIDVTASKVAGTLYTNDSGVNRFIVVQTSGTPAIAGQRLYVDGREISDANTFSNVAVIIYGVIPAGSTYKIVLSGGATVVHWNEIDLGATGGGAGSVGPVGPTGATGATGATGPSGSSSVANNAIGSYITAWVFPSGWTNAIMAMNEAVDLSKVFLNYSTDEPTGNLLWSEPATAYISGTWVRRSGIGTRWNFGGIFGYWFLIQRIA